MALVVSTEGQPPATTQYAAFTCSTLDPDPEKWTAAEKSRVATSAELSSGAVILEIPATADTLFVKLVAADHEIAKGTKLSDLQ